MFGEYPLIFPFRELDADRDEISGGRSSIKMVILEAGNQRMASTIFQDLNHVWPYLLKHSYLPVAENGIAEPSGFPFGGIEETAVFTIE